VGTTLSGYTTQSPRQDTPDLELVRQLLRRSPVPVFAEGRIWTPAQAARALAAGALFVVVGTAITNPQAITAHFAAALQRRRVARAGAAGEEADVTTEEDV
jgi:N-acylglucosamine-6-phosphate 2-epimerase